MQSVLQECLVYYRVNNLHLYSILESDREITLETMVHCFLAKSLCPVFSDCILCLHFPLIFGNVQFTVIESISASSYLVKA